MMRAKLSRLRRLFRKEDGSAAVEFVIIFPVVATMILLTLEMGFITLRQALLDRGLNIATREIRLGTGNAPEHDEIKDIVCANALFLRDCGTQLYLEMKPSNPRAIGLLNQKTSCTDRPVPSRPVRAFVAGQQNELVLIRACVLYDPLFPEGLLTRVLHKDINGRAAVISMTAFVQEPA